MSSDGWIVTFCG